MHGEGSMLSPNTCAGCWRIASWRYILYTPWSRVSPSPAEHFRSIQGKRYQSLPFHLCNPLVFLHYKSISQTSLTVISQTSIFSFHLGFSETSQAAVTSSAGVGHQLWFWTWSIGHRLMALPGDRKSTVIWTWWSNTFFIVPKVLYLSTRSFRSKCQNNSNLTPDTVCSLHISSCMHSEWIWRSSS